jgi:tRNA threonylcarbamoyladenosine biosynthesis protein TsaB
MIVLGIETATKVCGVGLVDGEEIVADIQIHRGYVHAERLPELISDLFKKTGIEKNELDGIAVSVGPGSFTGLRIGLGLAKGLAWGLNKPLIDVPTMEGLMSKVPRVCDWACVMMHARKGEIFQGLFQWQKSRWVPSGEYQVLPEKEIGKCMPGDKILFLGGVVTKYQKVLRQRVGEAIFVNPLLSLVNGYGIARQGHAMLMSGQTADIDTVTPIYLKKFQGVA